MILWKFFPLNIDLSVQTKEWIVIDWVELCRYRAIMGPFLWEVWLAVTLTYLLAMFPIAFSVWHSFKPLFNDISELDNMFWYVFGTFTNCFSFTGVNSWSRSHNLASRIFIGIYTIL